MKSTFLPILLALTFSQQALCQTNPVEVVDTLVKNAGPQPGFRKNHAKGICFNAEFKASKETKALSRSALFDGKSHPVIGRFSDAGGVPNMSDAKNVPRGMALQFDLGKAGIQNMSMLNIPVFIVSTPEGFLESLKAATPELQAVFKKNHPEAQPFFEYVGSHEPIASFATSSYYSLHAFELLNAKKKSQFIRWQFVPEAGEKFLTKDETAKIDPNYLFTDLKERAGKAPMKWKMVGTLAQKEDSLTDPTKIWPADRKKITLGEMTVSKVEDQIGGPCNTINYDPTRLVDGMAISEDPVLKFRSPAYAISFGKRLSEMSEKTK